MEAKNNNISDFIADKKTIWLKDLQEFYENYFKTHKALVEIKESDIPKIVNAIRDKYRIEYSQNQDDPDKLFYFSKIDQLINHVQSNHFFFCQYVSNPGFDREVINLFVAHLLTVFQSELNIIGFSQPEEDNSENNPNEFLDFKASEHLDHNPIDAFTFPEVVNLIHLLILEGFIKEDLSNKKIAKCFHQLTGYSERNIVNHMSPNKFQNDYELKKSRKILILKLRNMLNNLK